MTKIPTSARLVAVTTLADEERIIRATVRRYTASRARRTPTEWVEYVVDYPGDGSDRVCATFTGARLPQAAATFDEAVDLLTEAGLVVVAATVTVVA
jgi:hypothetical protein